MPLPRGDVSSLSYSRSEALPDLPSTLALLVEDEYLIQDLLESALQDAGYTVLVATNGEEGIALMEREAANSTALVTDVNLGAEPSGWEVARRARELNPKLLVVYLTGDSGHEYAARGLPNSLVLLKPFVGPDVVVALSTLKAQANSAPG